MFSFSHVTGQMQLIEQQRGPNRCQATELDVSVVELGETPVDVFLRSFRENGAECVSAAYLMQQTTQSLSRSSTSGTISTTLPEDVFTLVETQLSLLDDYLQSSQLARTDEGDAILVDGLLSILRILYTKQTHYRDALILDMESCLAAANDFQRMGEKIETLISDLSRDYPHLCWDANVTKERLSDWDVSVGLVGSQASHLVDLYGKDAVLAAQRAAIFVMRTIQQSDIPCELFSSRWEDELLRNEVAGSIVRTFDDYLVDMKQYLESDYLYQKVVAALVRATVCFYIQCFVIKAEKARHRKNRSGATFHSPKRAVTRIKYDVQAFGDYFREVTDGNEALKRLVMNELSVLTLLLECMAYAAGQSGTDSLEEFVLVVHKRTGAKSTITRYFLSDIYVLMARKMGEHHLVEQTVRRMKSDLDRVTERVNEKKDAFCLDQVSPETACFRLDEMLQALYEERILQEQASLCGTLVQDVKARAIGGHWNGDRLGTPTGVVFPSKRPMWQGSFEQLKLMVGIM